MKFWSILVYVCSWEKAEYVLQWKSYVLRCGICMYRCMGFVLSLGINTFSSMRMVALRWLGYMGLYELKLYLMMYVRLRLVVIWPSFVE
jgi:hypothetical protein